MAAASERKEKMMTERTIVEGPMMYWTDSEPDYWEEFSQRPRKIFLSLRKAQIVAWLFMIEGLGPLAGKGCTFEKRLLRWRKNRLIAFAVELERERMDALNDRRGAIRAMKRDRSLVMTANALPGP
jgi:hypothetical protein